jgi:hypothetical protein
MSPARMPGPPGHAPGIMQAEVAHWRGHLMRINLARRCRGRTLAAARPFDPDPQKLRQAQALPRLGHGGWTDPPESRAGPGAAIAQYSDEGAAIAA